MNLSGKAVKYWMDKENIRAFYVGDQLFAKRAAGKWYIVITEGAISELAMSKIPLKEDVV